MLLALITLALLLAYHLLRLVAGSCSGLGCDLFIPFSLLLPLAIAIMVAITGLRAIADSTSRTPTRRLLLGALTGIGIVGPIVALFVFRDQPDAFVWTATILIILLPVTVIAFRLARGHRPTGDPS